MEQGINVRQAEANGGWTAVPRSSNNNNNNLFIYIAQISIVKIFKCALQWYAIIK